MEVLKQILMGLVALIGVAIVALGGFFVSATALLMSFVIKIAVLGLVALTAVAYVIWEWLTPNKSQ